MRYTHRGLAGWKLLLPLLGGLGLAGLVLGVAQAYGPMQSAAKRPVVSPETGEACFATVDNGAFVFSSTNASAIQKAVDVATDGMVVKLAGYCSGVVTSGGTNQTVYITRPLTLAGGYTLTNWTTANITANPTTLDAKLQGRVVLITGVTVTLQGLTVTNGYLLAQAALGGGIYAGGALTLRNVTVYNNVVTGGVGYGGGAYVLGAANFTNTAFISNTALTGGGGAALTGPANLLNTTFTRNSTTGNGGGALLEGIATVVNTTFSNNLALSGGGVYAAGNAQITNSDFRQNQASNAGGGRFNGITSILGSTFINNWVNWEGGGATFYQTANITSTSFISNAGDKGGGVYFFGGGSTKTVVNSLFARNRSGNYGAAIYAGSPFQLSHSTITSPTLAGTTASPAIYVDATTAYITNTIITSHTVGVHRATGAVIMWNPLFFGNSSDTVGGVMSSNSVSGQPKFVNQAGDNYHLAVGSAAIDAGTTPNPALTFDIDGHLRPLGAGYDIGYDEFLSPVYRYLPLVRWGYCSPTVFESEPNNNTGQADGPLCANQTYQGAPDDANDYYMFYLANPGSIYVTMTNNVATGVQMQLVNVGNTLLGFAGSAPFQITCPNATYPACGQPGWYYIRVYAGGSYTTTPYSLIVTYP